VMRTFSKPGDLPKRLQPLNTRAKVFQAAAVHLSSPD